MQILGWIGKDRPRMVAVQSTGCAPMVRAWETGADHAEPWDNPHTIAHGLCVPGAIGDFLILQAIRESAGCAVAVSDRAMLEAMEQIGKTTGIFASPEGAATAAALPELVKRGIVEPGDRVLLFNTGSNLKYVQPL
jgi:threonine synthase